MLFWRNNGNRRCPRCGDRSFVYKCTVCGKRRCTSCGEWYFFYVLRKGDKSSIVKTKAFCSPSCEKRFLEPHVSRFYDEHRERANVLLKDNRRDVEEWFSSQMGHRNYDIWSEEFERLFKRPQLKEALERVMSGKTQVVEFETLDEAIDFKNALYSHCSSRKAWLEHIRIRGISDFLRCPPRNSPYLVFMDENWQKEDVES